MENGTIPDEMLESVKYDSSLDPYREFNSHDAIKIYGFTIHRKYLTLNLTERGRFVAKTIHNKQRYSICMVFLGLFKKPANVGK